MWLGRSKVTHVSITPLKAPHRHIQSKGTALCWLCKCSFKTVFSAFPFQFPIVFPCPIAGCSYVEILNSLKPRSSDKQFLNLLFLIQKWLMKVRWKCQAAGGQISLSASPPVNTALIACLTLRSLKLFAPRQKLPVPFSTNLAVTEEDLKRLSPFKDTMNFWLFF